MGTRRDPSLVPLALVVAAVRAWVRTGLEPTELLRLDPDRFERVEPPAEDGTDDSR